MKIALIAHDKRKRNLLNFVTAYKDIFSDYELFATGTTGKMIQEEIGLDVHRFQSGPLGGDQQIGAKIAANDLDLVVFFRDPLTAQPHEPDVTALLRLCDVYRIPLATNEASAEIMIRGIQSGWLDWRNVKESTSLYDE
ncbi:MULTISPECIES: methylglyoxal synthase [Allobacillus]|uniref:Methylglyoxal synthase n=1 Tax=Allobacillus halotolerans TaxID=570278 RepID=A0ABS6GJU2_9BACI|nr:MULTISPECIES: methylglyoxal synthase [Allobacillus]MBU6079497.1 methylglyoxal synthase [Allobacillus halotolerans]TSJ69049.1 methylglyoxal synthase [Allobacillus sp. SKP2-8]